MEISRNVLVLLAAVLGLSIGSFSTMLLSRVPRGETLLGRSRCPDCLRVLRWYDLVPVLSFLLLGGRCSRCHRPISWRYPVIELAHAGIFVLLVTTLSAASWIDLVLLAIASTCLLLIAFSDFATQMIPDVFLAALFLAALLHQTLGGLHDPLALRDAAWGAAIPFVFFGGLWSVSRGRWMGSGDILLGTSIGLLLGAPLTLLALFVAYTVGAVVALALLISRQVERGGRIAFAPFLSGGAFVALVLGERILAAYRGFLL